MKNVPIDVDDMEVRNGKDDIHGRGGDNGGAIDFDSFEDEDVIEDSPGSVQFKEEISVAGADHDAKVVLVRKRRRNCT